MPYKIDIVGLNICDDEKDVHFFTGDEFNKVNVLVENFYDGTKESVIKIIKVVREVFVFDLVRSKVITEAIIQQKKVVLKGEKE